MVLPILFQYIDCGKKNTTLAGGLNIQGQQFIPKQVTVAVSARMGVFGNLGASATGGPDVVTVWHVLQYVRICIKIDEHNRTYYYIWIYYNYAICYCMISAARCLCTVLVFIVSFLRDPPWCQATGFAVLPAFHSPGGSKKDDQVYHRIRLPVWSCTFLWNHLNRYVYTVNLPSLAYLVNAWSGKDNTLSRQGCHSEVSPKLAQGALRV